jgi:hypothetical protein
VFFYAEHVLKIYLTAFLRQFRGLAVYVEFALWACGGGVTAKANAPPKCLLLLKLLLVLHEHITPSLKNSVQN